MAFPQHNSLKKSLDAIWGNIDNTKSIDSIRLPNSYSNTRPVSFHTVRCYVVVINKRLTVILDVTTSHNAYDQKRSITSCDVSVG